MSEINLHTMRREELMEYARLNKTTDLEDALLESYWALYLDLVHGTLYGIPVEGRSDLPLPSKENKNA